MKAIIKLATNRVNEKKRKYTHGVSYLVVIQMFRNDESRAPPGPAASAQQPAEKNKTKKNYMISYYALLLLRFYFPAVYKIAEEPSIHQEQSKARAGACLLAAWPGVQMCPTGPGVFVDVQVVKKRNKKKKNHPLLTHKTIALFFLMKKKERWRGEREARVAGPLVK